MDIFLIIVLAVLGVGLIIVEAFMPGFGLPGLSGIGLELIAIFTAYHAKGPRVALLLALVILFIIAIALSIVLRSAAKGRLAKSKMVLHNVEGAEEGFVASEDMKVFIGREGTATTALRPTGIADFDGVRLNVVSEGDFIESGTKVCITEAEGSRIVVRPV